MRAAGGERGGERVAAGVAAGQGQPEIEIAGPQFQDAGMLQAFVGVLLGGIAHGGDCGQRRSLGLGPGGHLQLVARAGDLALDGFARGQHDAEFGIAANALHGGPRHGDFAEELALDGEFVAVLLHDGAGDGVTVGEHHLVGGQGREGEQQKREK